MPLPRLASILLVASAAFSQASPSPIDTPTPALIPESEILTPPESPAPRINGPKVFGVHPGALFLYTMPVSGQRPMTYSADHLPSGLALNATNGQITGSLAQRGTYDVILRAKNAIGSVERKFRIDCGDVLALTPPMGWSCYDCYKINFDQKMIEANAQAMHDSGLINYGFSFINIDDGWQGIRGGSNNAIQPDLKKFPDIAGLVGKIHALGLKAGIYSTPWVTSYGNLIGGTSDNPDGAWDKATMTKGPKNKKIFPFAIGKYSFAKQDAQQFADWGFDYLKYDWDPNEKPETLEMAEALKSTGRDIIYSLSNCTPFKNLPDFRDSVNLWRVDNDIVDKWWHVITYGMHKDRWAPFQKPGHYNDYDNLIIGTVAISLGHPHPSCLTADEQFTQVSLFCLLGAPFILGCDLTQLDPFTKSLITNPEVLDIDQDTLCKQGTIVAEDQKTGTLVYAKPLEDGSWAVGLFNTGNSQATVAVSWKDLGNLTGKQTVRDLWRHKDLVVCDNSFSALVNSHGVVMLKISPAVTASTSVTEAKTKMTPSSH